MPKQVDRHLLERRAHRSMHTYDQQALAQQAMADGLLTALAAAGPARYGRVLEIGCGTGLLTRRLLARFGIGTLYANDLIPAYAGSIEPLAAVPPAARVAFLAGDIETVPLPADLDLVISNAVLHWIRDLPALVARLHAALRPGGRLAFAACGPENLREIRRLTNVSLHYRSLAEVAGIVGRHFTVTAQDEYLRTVPFPSAAAVLRHLRETGVNALRREHWTRGRLRAFENDYRALYGQDDGRLLLTYHVHRVLAEKTDGDPLHRGH